jgi:outer membrane biosynthesis protein TonB
MNSHSNGRLVKRTTLGRPERRRRFSFLLLLSCLIHGTLVILLAVIFAKRVREALPEPEPPPPEVTLEIPPPEKNERPMVEAKEITDKKPENAPFESDQHSKAASEQPPDGSLPLPSQKGITQAALELQDQRHTSGEKPASKSGNPAPQPPSPATPPETSQQIPPQPSPSTLPQPSSTPSATPKASPTSTPPPNNIKLLEPPDQEPPQDVKKPQLQDTSRSQSPSQNRQASEPGNKGTTKGYQPETRQTVIRGNISNRGRSSVEAEATPIGRYKKAVADAIGSRWYYLVDERMGLLSIGTVSVSFKVSGNGKVTGLHVVSSNSNESLTDCSLRSIMDAKLPPIPPDVSKTLQDGSLEIDYSFTIY